MAAIWTVLLVLLVLGDEDLSAVHASGSSRGLPTDDKISIIPPPSVFLMGSCPKPSSPKNVRLQSIKTNSGLIFSRKGVTQDVFECFESLSKQDLSASNIVECSRQTEEAGLQMFRWHDGVCTGYPNGIPGNCVGTGSVVLYSLQVAAAKEATITDLAHNTTEVNTAIVTWDANVVGGSICTVIYKIIIGDVVKYETSPTTTLSLDGLPPCTEVPAATVAVINADNVEIGSDVIMLTGPYAEEPTFVSMSFSHKIDHIYFNWTMDDPCESIENYTVNSKDRFNFRDRTSDPFHVAEYSIVAPELCETKYDLITFFFTTKNGTTRSFWIPYNIRKIYGPEEGMYALFNPWSIISACALDVYHDTEIGTFNFAKEICSYFGGQLFGGPFTQDIYDYLPSDGSQSWADLTREAGVWIWGGTNTGLQGNNFAMPPLEGEDCGTLFPAEDGIVLLAKNCSEEAKIFCVHQY